MVISGEQKVNRDFSNLLLGEILSLPMSQYFYTLALLITGSVPRMTLDLENLADFS